MRRYLIITASVIVVIGILLGFYFLFFSSSAEVTVAPVGGGLPTSGQGGTTQTGAITPSSESPTPVTARLVKIASGPIVPGAVVVNVGAPNATTSPETKVFFIERRSGNVFSYATRTKTLTRTSNRTVPGIELASWLPDASFAFVRYLSGVDLTTTNTYALPQNGAGGFFLSQNLTDLDVSSAGVLTLASGVNGSTASLSKTDGSKNSTLFSTPLSSLRVAFAGKNQYLAFTKPSATLQGSAYLVDGNGRFSRIAGPLTGLVALASPSGKWVLVSHTQGGFMQMSLVDTANGTLVPLPVATIADKCVWASDESAVFCGIPQNPSTEHRYPDDWYQGAVAFSDRIWKINVSGRFAQLILDFTTETNEELDATALAVDPSSTVLVFVNKNTGSLWGYSL